MTPPRHVHTLHLTAPSDRLLQRGQILLEDALHTASLPFSDTGRLLLIRSLQVGPIHPHQSPATLALTLEQRLQQLTPIAIHASDPAAPYHPAIYFRDASEPYILLALRLAHHQPTDAWFWPLAIPHWQAPLPPDEGFRLLLRELSQTPTGPIALATLIQELEQQQAIAPLLAALRWQDGPDLLQQCGWSRPNLPLTLIESPPTKPLSPKWEHLLAEVIQRWSAEDARTLWLATLLQLIEKPGRSQSPVLIQRSQQEIKRVWQKRSPLPLSPKIPTFQLPVTSEQPLSFRKPNLKSSTPPEPAISATVEPKPIQPEPIPDPTVPPVSTNPSTSEAEANPIFSTISSVTTAAVPDQEAHPATRPTEFDSPQPTAHAGFFFLISLLNRLGISTLLENRPELIELDFPLQLLHRIGQRLEIPATDPVLLALGYPDHASGENLALLEPLITTWRIDLRRWCRRYPKLGLHSLVQRPGQIAASRTHIDLLFDLCQVDVRIRRTGLDFNPGWVPWLGRIVTFHYGDGSYE